VSNDGVFSDNSAHVSRISREILRTVIPGY
jgi:hypothetical protein